jgi:hypothetical protein
MTSRRPAGPLRRLALELLLGGLALLGAIGCSDPSGSAGAQASPQPSQDDSGSALDKAGAVAGSVVSARRALRDSDTTDVEQLAQTMAASAAGDASWIDVFAQLRAQSWLATRYPGDYDLTDIYRDEAVQAARANEEQNLALGVYLDEPLPDLVTVAKTRELGELVELDVVLSAGPATVRGLDDDLARGTLPGGTHRGLFTIGRDGAGGRWRIHSVAELQVVEPTGQEPSS